MFPANQYRQQGVKYWRLIKGRPAVRRHCHANTNWRPFPSYSSNVGPSFVSRPADSIRENQHRRCDDACVDKFSCHKLGSFLSCASGCDSGDTPVTGSSVIRIKHCLLVASSCQINANLRMKSGHRNPVKDPSNKSKPQIHELFYILVQVCKFVGSNVLGHGQCQATVKVMPITKCIHK